MSQDRGNHLHRIGSGQERFDPVIRSGDASCHTERTPQPPP